jgi:hypothetical protein
MTASELLVKILPRLPSAPPTVAFMDALNLAIRVIADRLWELRSPILNSDFALTVTAHIAIVTLPTGFLGLKSDPVLDWDGSRSTLEHLPTGYKYDSRYKDEGIPECFELLPTTMKLYPTPKSPTTSAKVYGDCFAFPAALTTLAGATGTIPFNGIFDMMLIDTVLMLGLKGLPSVIEPPMQAYLKTQVDQLADRRPYKTIVWRYPA